MTSVEDIIRMREEAIHSLLEQKEQLLRQLEELHARVVDVETNLQRLGYTGVLQKNTVSPTKSPVSKTFTDYTIEMLLDGKEPAVIRLYNDLSEKILMLGSGIKISAHKKFAAFGEIRNFCEVVVWVSKLTIYINIPQSSLIDPRSISEDCSKIGRWATGETRFQLSNGDGMEYALDLIKQSYQYNLLKDIGS